MSPYVVFNVISLFFDVIEFVMFRSALSLLKLIFHGFVYYVSGLFQKDFKRHLEKSDEFECNGRN
jgi:hypothetical protein